METIRAIIEAGADVNTDSLWFGTPLYLAAIRGDQAAVELLVEHNASVNKYCIFLGSAAHAACVGGDMATVQALHAAGADWAVSKLIHINNICHLSRLAQDNGSLVSYLIDPPGNQFQSPGAMAVNFRHYEAVDFCLNLAKGLSVHEAWTILPKMFAIPYKTPSLAAASTECMSLLSLSMSTLDVRTAESLLNHGARDNLLDPIGRGALAYALDATRLHFTHEPDLESCVALLIRHGVDINGLCSRHKLRYPSSVIGKLKLKLFPPELQTALIDTICYRENHRSRVHCVEVLCNNGANVESRDSDGKSALDLARRHLKGEELIEVERILLLHSNMRPTENESSSTS